MFDIYIPYLGQAFSEMTVWILLGVLIAIYSETKKKAMLNVFLFCIGMLIAYYATAIITHSIYGKIFIKFWVFFSCLSPIFAYFTWMSKEKGIVPNILRAGIVFLCILSGFLFQGFEIHDIIINIILIYHLYIKKNVRN